ncbi:MAG: radical SAM protein [Magnetococcales bacterium]|nr:radical SAM protein [Magnetococcales bacterium]
MKKSAADLKVLLTCPCNYNASGELVTAPLGLSYLVESAREKIPGITFEIGLADEATLAEFQPDIVGISAYTAVWSKVLELAQNCKRRGIHVVVGGPHVEIRPEDLSPDMDVGVIGEAEQSFPELLLQYDEGWSQECLEQLPGMIFRDEKTSTVRNTGRPPVIQDLNELPIPLLHMDKLNDDILCIMTCRGCPFYCRFCATPSHDNVRVFSPEYIVQYIKKHLEHYPNIRTIKIWDDLFTLNRRRLKAIAKILNENGLIDNFKYIVATRADHITPKSIEILKSMNVTDVSMGLESGSPTTLEYINKGYKVDKIIRAVELLDKAKINIQASFIIGFPYETNEHIQETYDLIKKLPIHLLQVFLLIPYPGTDIWDDAVKGGIIQIDDDFDWSSLDILASLEEPEHVLNGAVVVSKTLNRKELYAWLKKFYSLVQKKRFLFGLRLLRKDPMRLYHRLKREVFFLLGKE